MSLTIHDIYNPRNDGTPDPTQADILNAIGIYRGRVTTDVTTNQQTLQPVNDLSFPVLANEFFYFRIKIYVGSSSTAGVKIGFTFPAGAVVTGKIFGNTSSLSLFTTEAIPTSGTASTNAYNTFVANTIGVGGMIEVEGTIRNGGTDGTFLVKGLKVTSGTASIFTDSGFIAIKMN